MSDLRGGDWRSHWSSGFRTRWRLRQPRRLLRQNKLPSLATKTRQQCKEQESPCQAEHSTQSHSGSGTQPTGQRAGEQ